MTNSLVDTGVITIRSLLIILPFLMGGFHCLWKRQTPAFSKSECFLVYFLVIGIGLRGLLMGHLEIFHSDAVASFIGLPNSFFLIQLGKANVAFGMLGILSFWFRRGWRTATASGTALFLFLVSIEHIQSLIMMRQTPHLKTLEQLMVIDFITAVCLILLLIFRQTRKVIP